MAVLAAAPELKPQTAESAPPGTLANDFIKAEKGQVPMPPNPELAAAELDTLVNRVLQQK